jgi:hypothetical protein
MAEQEKDPLGKLDEGLSGFKRLRQRFGMPVAVLLALSVAGGLIWWNWDHIVGLPGVESTLERLRQRAIKKVLAGRLTIAVAHLYNDKDREDERKLLDEADGHIIVCLSV